MARRKSLHPARPLTVSIDDRRPKDPLDTIAKLATVLGALLSLWTSCGQ